jgi:predicted ATPase/transcriptional regulator with XRE-family HTH domain
LPAAIRAHRVAAGLTQEELARRAGIGVRTVRELERGRVTRPQRGTVELLAAAFGLVGAERDTFLAAAGHPLSGEPPDAGAPMPLPPRPDLVGRERDVAELEEVLSTADLVTLVGLAGVGKTCLALNVAHRLARLPTVRAAVVFVHDVSGADDILAATAAVFGIGRATELADRLAGGRVLLLVDNIDRAPRASTEAIQWLRARVPSLKVLATSRLPLGIPGAVEWRVEPLDVPPADAGPDLAALRRYPAVALFLARLRQVRREQVTPAEVPALVTLVRRLGGLPIALELAAARGRVLDVRELLARYGDRVLDLGGAEPDGERLRDAVAASYRLLDPDEQYALRRLSVVRWRWSLEFAEALLGDRPELDVEAILDRFVGLGLVSARGASEHRFRLLDVVTDFAGEACAEAGELPAARARHAEVVTRLAVRVSADLVGSAMATAVSRLDMLNSDIGAALGYAWRHAPVTALRLAAAIPRWYRFRGRDRDGHALLRRLLDDPRTGQAEPRLRAWAQLGVAMLAAEHGDGAVELATAEAALSTFRTYGDTTGELAARGTLSVLWQTVGGYTEAHHHADAMLTLAVRTGRVSEVAVAQTNLARLDVRTGDLVTAGRRLAVAAQRAQQVGDARLRSLAQADLAEVTRLDGRYAEAVELARRVRPGVARYGDPGHRVRLLGTLGLALADDGNPDEAAEVLAELTSLADSGSGAPGTAGVVALVAGQLALRQGDRPAAAAAFTAAADALAGRYDARDLLETLVGAAASLDGDERERTLDQVVGLCERAGLSLLPRDRALLEEGPGGRA